MPRRARHVEWAALAHGEIQEFFVTVTRKLQQPLAPEAAAEVTRELARLPVAAVDAGVVLAAIDKSRSYPLSLRDAMIVECAVLLSEDLQDGMRFGRVRIENPLA